MSAQQVEIDPGDAVAFEQRPGGWAVGIIDAVELVEFGLPQLSVYIGGDSMLSMPAATDGSVFILKRNRFLSPLALLIGRPPIPLIQLAEQLNALKT